MTPMVTMVSRPITQHFLSQFKMLTINILYFFKSSISLPCCHGDRSIFRNVILSTLSSIALLPKHSFAAKIVEFLIEDPSAVKGAWIIPIHYSGSIT